MSPNTKEELFDIAKVGAVVVGLLAAVLVPVALVISCENEKRGDMACSEFRHETPCDVPARCYRELGLQGISCTKQEAPTVVPVVVAH